MTSIEKTIRDGLEPIIAEQVRKVTAMCNAAATEWKVKPEQVRIELRPDLRFNISLGTFPAKP